MGTCSGKKVFVSNSRDVSVEFKPGKSAEPVQTKSKFTQPSRKVEPQPDTVRDTANTDQPEPDDKDKPTDQYEHPDILTGQSDIRGDIQNTDDDISEVEAIKMVKELNRKNSTFDKKAVHKTKVNSYSVTGNRFRLGHDDMRTLHDTDLIEQTIDEVYEHVLNSNLLQEKENEILEVIREDEEIEMDNDNISLVESEIMDEIAQCLEDKIKSNREPTVNNKVEKRKISNVSCKSLNRSESKDSVKSERKKKSDKKEIEKDKLWTSRGTAVKWKQEKVYTTMGKDGTLFKIRILRKPGKDDADKGANRGKYTELLALCGK